MTLWGINDENDGKLYYFSFDETEEFLRIEGDILGVEGAKDIEDIAIDSNGTIFFINNFITSKLL
jgi:glycine cleavage system H lipoate-binding protein